MLRDIPRTVGDHMKRPAPSFVIEVKGRRSGERASGRRSRLHDTMKSAIEDAEAPAKTAAAAPAAAPAPAQERPAKPSRRVLPDLSPSPAPPAVEAEPRRRRGRPPGSKNSPRPGQSSRSPPAQRRCRKRPVRRSPRPRFPRPRSPTRPSRPPPAPGAAAARRWPSSRGATAGSAACIPGPGDSGAPGDLSFRNEPRDIPAVAVTRQRRSDCDERHELRQSDVRSPRGAFGRGSRRRQAFARPLLAPSPGKGHHLRRGTFARCRRALLSTG